MLSDLYNEKILAHAANIPRVGRLAQPDASATQRSRLCGSQVTVDVVMDGDLVVDFAHEVKACALGQAASSIMAASVIGATVAELETLEGEMTRMLAKEGPGPGGRWGEFACLVPVADHKSRHASTMLTFRATLEAARKAVLARAA
ncbi:MAG: iron-sulfur cluster assembly scaffold protein [Pseudomonadota bacterium]